MRSSILIAVTLAVGLAASCDAKNRIGYQLMVQHNLWGPEQILVSDKGLKLLVHKHAFSAYLTPPTWKAYFYSDGRKIYAEAGSGRKLKLLDAPKCENRDAVLIGLPVTIYSISPNRPYAGDVFDNYMPQMSDVSRAEKKRQARQMVVREEVACMRVSDLPQAARATLRSVYGVDGFPLQYTITLSDGQKISRIKFTGWKNVDLPASTFVVPKGYKQVASLNEIVNYGISSQVEAFSQEWGDAPDELGKRRP